MIERLQSFKTQNLFLEYAALKHVRPAGIYVSLTPGNPRLWTAVLFIRKGLYKSAILRFRIIFPSRYPAIAPLVVFSSEVFHPLVMSPSGGQEESVFDKEGMSNPLGLFNLGQEFPRWAKGSTSPDNSSGIFGSVRSAETSEIQRISPEHGPDSKESASVDMPIISVLRYVRSCFDDEEIIDSIVLEHAVNPSAWYAWRAHRAELAEKSTLIIERRSRPPKDPSEWNWNGVFASRVERAVKESLSEAAVYGGNSEWDETIRFSGVADDGSPSGQSYEAPLH